MKARRIEFIHLIVLAIVCIAAFSYTFNPKLDLNGDNARYIELARNMAHGMGYATEGTTGEMVPHSHFPIGYPAILSILVTVGLDNLIAFKILNLFLLIGAVLMLYSIVKKHTGNDRLALCIGILVAVTPQILKFAVMAMSETTFMFFMILSLFALSQAGDGKKEYDVYFWTAAIAAAYCYYLRAVGAAVIFAVLVFYLFRKEWKKAITSTAVSAVCILPWFLRNKALGVGRNYISPILAKNPWRPEEGMISSFGEFMQKIWKNLDDTTLSGYRYILFPNWQNYLDGQTTAFRIILGIILVAIVIWGIWKTGRMRYALLALMIANTGFILIWNGNNDVRYVTPFVPFVVLGFWNGIFNILEPAVRKLGKSSVKYLPYAFLLMLFVMKMPLKDAHEKGKEPLPEPYTQYYFIAESLNAQFDAGNKPVVCCRKPELWKYYAPNTISVSYPFTDNSRQLIQKLYDDNVSYVILDNLGYASTYLYLLPAINDHSDLFEIVYSAEGKETNTYLLFFDREKVRNFLQTNN